MPETPSTAIPHLLTAETLVGAANPLWCYFTGAVLWGMGWWWASRWLMLAPTAVLEASEIPATLRALAAEPALTPVGGEAAPVSPMALAMAPRTWRPAESQAARPH